MKKILLAIVGFMFCAFSVDAKQYKLNVSEPVKEEKKVVLNRTGKAYRLLFPVKLTNPLREKLGLEAGGPKYTVYKKVVAEKVTPVVENGNVEVVNVVEEPKFVHAEPVAEKKKTDIVERKKDIDEAKKLLEESEKLSSDIVKSEPVKVEEKKVVKKTNKFKNFSVKFAAKNEDLLSADKKKFNRLATTLQNDKDMIVKILSYYKEDAERDMAFSRLLNARKVLLENDVETSQIIIMVLQDNEKSNIIDVIVENTED